VLHCHKGLSEQNRKEWNPGFVVGSHCTSTSLQPWWCDHLNHLQPQGLHQVEPRLPYICDVDVTGTVLKVGSVVQHMQVCDHAPTSCSCPLGPCLQRPSRPLCYLHKTKGVEIRSCVLMMSKLWPKHFCFIGCKQYLRKLSVIVEKSITQWWFTYIALFMNHEKEFILCWVSELYLASCF
jgi:hypothetical protein